MAILYLFVTLVLLKTHNNTVILPGSVCLSDIWNYVSKLWNTTFYTHTFAQNDGIFWICKWQGFQSVYWSTKRLNLSEIVSFTLKLHYHSFERGLNISIDTEALENVWFLLKIHKKEYDRLTVEQTDEIF